MFQAQISAGISLLLSTPLSGFVKRWSCNLTCGSLFYKKVTSYVYLFLDKKHYQSIKKQLSKYVLKVYTLIDVSERMR